MEDYNNNVKNLAKTHDNNNNNNNRYNNNSNNNNNIGYGNNSNMNQIDKTVIIIYLFKSFCFLGIGIYEEYC
jgi:hypothetical protein